MEPSLPIRLLPPADRTSRECDTSMLLAPHALDVDVDHQSDNSRSESAATKRRLGDRHYLASLDVLRGTAALSVCLFHFTSGNRAYLPSDDPVRTVGSFGWLGVEVFFTISGFVIPYSLDQRSYHLRDAPSFLM